MKKLFREISVITMFFIWSGAILGLSFIATPIKFKAEGLTLSVSIEIGKVTFHFFNKIEWFAFILCGILTYSSKIRKYSYLTVITNIYNISNTNIFIISCS